MEILYCIPVTEGFPQMMRSAESAVAWIEDWRREDALTRGIANHHRGGVSNDPRVSDLLHLWRLRQKARRLVTGCLAQLKKSSREYVCPEFGPMRMRNSVYRSSLFDVPLPSKNRGFVGYTTKTEWDQFWRLMKQTRWKNYVSVVSAKTSRQWRSKGFLFHEPTTRGPIVTSRHYFLLIPLFKRMKKKQIMECNYVCIFHQ